MDKIELIRAHYERRMIAGRASFEVLDWASPASQAARFEVLLRHVPLEGKTLLDVGCGLGDLLALLRQRGVAADYTGVDVLDKMIDACRSRFPDGRFRRADVFRGEIIPPGQFDVVFTSGVFNLNLGNNLTFLPAAIRRLLAIAREHLVFNLLHVRSADKEDDYFFYDPQDILRIVRAEAVEATLVEDYLPNDFTVICRKSRGGEHPGGL